jgi:hypothetical protein
LEENPTSSAHCNQSNIRHFIQPAKKRTDRRIYRQANELNSVEWMNNIEEHQKVRKAFSTEKLNFSV